MKRIITLALAAALTLSMAVSTAAVDKKGANNAAVKTTIKGISTVAQKLDGVITKYEYEQIALTDADLYYSGSTDARLNKTTASDFKAYASYDKDNMYVAIVVKTPDYVLDVDPISNMWQQHCLQISCAKGDEKTPATRTELGIGRNSKTDALVFNSWADAYKTSYKADTTGKDFTVVTKDGVTTYEMKLPAKLFGITEFKKGETVGLNFCLNIGTKSDDRGVIEYGSGCANGKDATKFAKITLGDAIVIPKPATKPAAETADFASIAVVALAMSAAAAVVISKKH